MTVDIPTVAADPIVAAVSIVAAISAVAVPTVATRPLGSPTYSVATSPNSLPAPDLQFPAAPTTASIQYPSETGVGPPSQQTDGNGASCILRSKRVIVPPTAGA